MDALCQQKMSKSALEELFLTRGIILSSKLDKELAATHFSRMSHDYFDHKFISDTVSVSSSKDRKKSYYAQEFEFSKAEDAVKNLIESREGKDDRIDYSQREKSLYIDLSYTYYDHKQPEFRQAITKTVQIAIESQGDGITVRYPDDEYTTEVSDQLLGEMCKVEGKDVAKECVSLAYVADSTIKTKFFEETMQNMEGMTVCDVSDVSVYNPQTGQDEGDLGVRIKKASLNGEGVLSSGELKQFKNKNFFVYKITWLMKEDNMQESPIYRFSAQFNDPDICDDFSYLCRGSKKVISGNRHSKQFSSLSDIDELRMIRKLECASRIAKDKVIDVDRSININAASGIEDSVYE